MKRLLLSLTMFFCSLLMFAQFSGTVSDSQGVRYTANDDDSTCYVSGHEHLGYRPGYSLTITIPKIYEGRMVTSIGDSAFYNIRLNSLTIPNSVTSIGESAFESCWELKSLTLPNSVVSIGNRAFQYCRGLTSMTIPNSVTSIGESAFFWCHFTSLTIGNSVTSIGRDAFRGCRMTSVTIPNSVTSIGRDAFRGCRMTSVTIPNSVTSIGESAFSGCSSLTSLTIGNSVTFIDKYTFKECSALTSVTIPNSVTSIGESAFSGCSSLTSLTIGNSVTSIGYHAFDGCSGLTSITIPNSVTSIDYSAFYGCSGLTSVDIPNSVTSIGQQAFSGCSGLTSITVENGNPKYDSRNNCNAIIETVTNTLHTGCKNTIIPNSVISIGGSAFQGCSGLTSVDIPNSVTSIGGGAFSGCRGLTSVTIPNSVTSIGNSTFIYCSGLTSMTIPNSVTSIGDWAFEGCSGLTSITIPNSVTSIGDWAFEGCSGLTSITIPNSVTSIGQQVFSGCSGLTSITVENGNPKYDSRNNCNAIIETATDSLLTGCQNTVIPNSVTSIGDFAFYGCSSLTSVTIPNSVTSIGNHAFRYCSGLTSVIIPNSVTSIVGCAFFGCSSLIEVSVGLTTPLVIDDYCFTNRANATLYVPEGSKEAYQAAQYWNEFKEIIELALPAVEGDENVDFGDKIDDDTNLDGNIVGDIYYVISSGDGSYNAGEGCIVVTKPTDDTAIDGQDIFGENFKDNYTGIVFKVPAGKGTVTVEAKTEGNMVLKVKIGDAAPISMELEGRLKVTVPYDVTEPTYIYIYGGSKPAAAPATRRAATESGELKLYGFTVTSSATGIKDTSHDNTITDSRYYTLDGRALDGVPARKGVYIVNGKKVVVK